MTQRERQIGVLTAAGHSAKEIARQLGCSTATVDRARALQDVQALVEQKSKTGISPRDVLEAMLYSTSDSTRLKAATELAKLPESIEPDLPPPLAEGVVRITREDHLGTSTTRVYPPPPFEDEKDGEFDEEMRRLGERDFGDPNAHTLDHFQAAQDLVYPKAADADE